MNFKTYQAPKGKVYVHKKNNKLFGEVVIITGEEEYDIEDFVLLSKEEHKKKLKKEK